MKRDGARFLKVVKNSKIKSTSAKIIQKSITTDALEESDFLFEHGVKLGLLKKNEADQDDSGLKQKDLQIEDFVLTNSGTLATSSVDARVHVEKVSIAQAATTPEPAAVGVSGNYEAAETLVIGAGGLGWGLLGGGVVVAAITSAGSSGAVVSASVLPVTYTVTVALGPLISASSTSITLKFYRADTGLPLDGTSLYANGTFSFIDTSGYKGKVLVKVVDGNANGTDYIDEATGHYKDMPDAMWAFTSVAGDSSLTVSPLTTLATMKALKVDNVKDIEGAVANRDGASVDPVIANRAIAAFFGLETGADVTTAVVNFAVGSNGFSDNTVNAYGKALTVISTMENQMLVDTSTDALLTSLASAVTLTGPTLTFSTAKVVGEVATRLMAAAKTPMVGGAAASFTVQSISELATTNVKFEPLLAIKSGEDANVNATEPSVNIEVLLGDLKEGYVIQLQSADANIGAPYIVLSSDAATSKATLNVLKADLGADGAKLLTARLMDKEGNLVATTKVPLGLAVDTLAPTLSIGSDKSALKAGETSLITFTFSEDPGDTFAVGDVDVTGGTLGVISGTGLTRTAIFTPTSNTNAGTASISVVAGTYTDAAGNAATSKSTLAFDMRTPTLSIGSDKSALKAGETSLITFTFSDDPGDTFAVGDVDVTGGTLGMVSGTGLTRTAIFTPTSNTNAGTASISVVAGTYTDAAGNKGGAGSKIASTFDTKLPIFSMPMALPIIVEDAIFDSAGNWKISGVVDDVTASINLHWSDSDTLNTSNLENVGKTASLIQNNNGTAAWSVVFGKNEISSLASGKALLTIQAKDANGNFTESQSRLVLQGDKKNLQTLSIVAHYDDDLLFQNPNIYNNIKSGNSHTTIYTTASDAGLTSVRSSQREEGIKKAYSLMADVAPLWINTELLVNIFGNIVKVRSSYLKSAPQVRLIFLDLPDGNTAGTGFSLSNYQTLRYLWDGGISNISTYFNANKYTKDDLVSLILGLVNMTSPDVIFTSSYSLDTINNHSDHITTSLFAHQALASYHQSYEAYSFVDYISADLPVNLSASDAAIKNQIFSQYAKYDSAMSTTTNPDGTVTVNNYPEYTKRNYLVGGDGLENDLQQQISKRTYQAYSVVSEEVVTEEYISQLATGYVNVGCGQYFALSESLNNLDFSTLSAAGGGGSNAYKAGKSTVISSVLYSSDFNSVFFWLKENDTAYTKAIKIKLSNVNDGVVYTVISAQYKVDPTAQYLTSDFDLLPGVDMKIARFNADSGYGLYKILIANKQGNEYSSGFQSGKPVNVWNATGVNIKDNDGVGDLSYQWYLDGQVLVNQSNSLYISSQLDVGRSLSSAVSFIDGVGDHEKINSSYIII
jgi:hypothetical protein